jgi:hypothetical protein
VPSTRNKYEEVQGTWYFVQQDKQRDEWTAIDTVPTSYNVGRKFRPTTISTADVDNSDGSTHGHQTNAPVTVSTTDMSQTALSTAAAALTLAGTKALSQVASFLGKGKKPEGQPPAGGGPPGGTGGGGGLPGGPPAGGGPFGPPGSGAPGCYGRSTVVSDLDGWGFVLNVRWRKSARGWTITKSIQRSDG